MYNHRMPETLLMRLKKHIEAAQERTTPWESQGWRFEKGPDLLEGSYLVAVKGTEAALGLTNCSCKPTGLSVDMFEEKGTPRWGKVTQIVWADHAHDHYQETSLRILNDVLAALDAAAT
jgi:hypothetical protein